MAVTDQRDFALELTQQLRSAGFEALWAGGCVRDQLLGREPQDFDVATNARPDEIRQLFGKRRTLELGAAFGVISVLGRGALHPIEVATFRSDGAYVDGRHPSTVEFTTAEQDAQRRDFTINGLFLEPLTGEVIDYVGGQADLAAGVVRAIGDPYARFREDKLRVLRGVRFATTFGFEIEPATFAAIHDMADEVSVVSAERIGAEFQKLLTHRNRAEGVRLLQRTGLLRPLIPELSEIAAQDAPVWQETLRVLEHLDTERFATAFAALFSGLPSVDSRKTTAHCGRQFRLSNKEIDLAEWLLRQLPLVAEAEKLTWPRLQRVLIAAEVSELLTLARALWGANHAGVRKCNTLLQLPPAELNPEPLLTGNDLVRHGLEPGPHFADLLTAVRDAQLEGQIADSRQALELVDRLREL